MPLEVQTRMKIAAPADKVFEAWVDPEQMSGYFISRGTGRMEAGKTVTWSWDDHADAKSDIEVLEIDKPNSLSFRWSPGGSPSTVNVGFEDEGDGLTEVSVRDGTFEADAAGIARYGEQMQGWVHMLTCLKAYLEYERMNLREGACGSHEVQVEASLRASADQIYHAWTREWASWFGLATEAVMQPEVGAPFWFAPTHEGKRYPHYGRYLRLEQDRLIDHTWANEPTRGVETRVTVELTPEGEGTHVRLTHGGFGDRASAKGHEANWPHVLTYLDDWIAKRE